MENKLNQTTHMEILDAINKFSTRMDRKFLKIEQKFDKVDQRLSKVDQRLCKVEKNVTKINATMVTKEYLDDKLADQYSDLVLLMRKEDDRIKALI